MGISRPERLAGAVLAVLIGFAALAPGVAHAQVFVPGDINADGSFNVADSSVLRRALLALPPGISQTCVALPGDVNADSSFDSTDAAVLRNALVGLGPGISQTCQAADADGDGFEVSDGDCDDTNPLVNPAAYDFIGNGLDDDCDGVIDSPRAVCDVGLASDESAPTSYALAMDLCQTAVESPPANQRTWGVISGAFTLASNAGSPSALARSIRSSFGANNPPRFGNALAVLSTATAAAPGQLNPAHGTFQLGTALGSISVLPPDWLAANSGVPPVAPGCPALIDDLGRDSIMLRLRIRVPSNARAFRLAAKHFSSDYPEFVCSPYVDSFIVLLDSSFAGAPANPADKNLATVAGGGPVGANLAFGSSPLFTDCLNGPTGCDLSANPGNTTSCTGTSGLTSTGMDVLDPPGDGEIPGFCGSNNMTGGATSWLALQGNVVPGETIELRIAIWDTGDGSWDSFVLLDDFRWLPTEITPGAVAN